MTNHNYNDQLTVTQEKVIVWTTRGSGLVSFVGSIIIIRMILHAHYNRESARSRASLKVRQRFMLCMSFFDILSSISNSFSTAAMPQIKETYGTNGNESTCITQAFFLQLGIAVPMYNAALCLYYLCVIRYSMTEKRLSGVFERSVHVIVITYALTTAIVGVTLDLFHDTGFFCWLIEYPLNCELDSDIQCTNNHKQIIIFFFGIFPVLVSFFIVFISMILVYLSMHNNYIRMRKYSFRGQHSPGVLSLLKEKQKTAKQATLFVLAFFLTWIIPFVNVVLILSNKTVPFCTALIQGLLMPLQGFWNALIYIRPTFVKLRKENPDRTLCWIMKAIIIPIVES